MRKTFRDTQQALLAKSDPDHTFCNWFVLCREEATGVTSMPILGKVPTCKLCADFANAPVDGLCGRKSSKAGLQAGEEDLTLQEGKWVK